MPGLTRRGDQPSLRPDLIGVVLELDHRHVFGLPTGRRLRVRVTRVGGDPGQAWVPVHGFVLDVDDQPGETLLLVYRSALPPPPEIEGG